jgi:large conductance mechanosensitive channel
MLDEFKKFILKGNVIDLSTGVVIGAAFGGIVKAFTDGIVQPILGYCMGYADPNIPVRFWIFDIGMVISAMLNFLIVAAVVFFLIIKPMNHIMAMMKAKEAAAPPPGPTLTETLLMEIRDSLKK